MNCDAEIKEVSERLGLPFDTCKAAYAAQWNFIIEHIAALPLKEELTEEEFDKLKTNFNIPSLGKLFCTKQLYMNIKRRNEIIKYFKEQKDDKGKGNQASV